MIAYDIIVEFRYPAPARTHVKIIFRLLLKIAVSKLSKWPQFLNLCRIDQAVWIYMTKSSQTVGRKSMSRRCSRAAVLLDSGYPASV